MKRCQNQIYKTFDLIQIKMKLRIKKAQDTPQTNKNLSKPADKMICKDS